MEDVIIGKSFLTCKRDPCGSCGIRERLAYKAHFEKVWRYLQIGRLVTMDGCHVTGNDLENLRRETRIVRALGASQKPVRNVKTMSACRNF